MTAAAKMNLKWFFTTLGSVLAILITVISATASMTTKYNSIKTDFVTVENDFKKNNADHKIIMTSLANEVTRAIAADANNQQQAEKIRQEVKEEIEKVGSEVKEINDNQIQVMTNQGIILKAVEKKTP